MEEIQKYLEDKRKEAEEKYKEAPFVINDPKPSASRIDKDFEEFVKTANIYSNKTNVIKILEKVEKIEELLLQEREMRKEKKEVGVNILPSEAILYINEPSILSTELLIESNEVLPFLQNVDSVRVYNIASKSVEEDYEDEISE